jgi:uncharacterized protein YjaG (DUF416 family)
MTYTMVTKQKTQMEKTIMTNKNKVVKAIDKEVGILYTLYRVLLSSLK